MTVRAARVHDYNAPRTARGMGTTNAGNEDGTPGEQPRPDLPASSFSNSATFAAGLLLMLLMVCVLVPAGDPAVLGLPRDALEDHLRSVELECAEQAAWERDDGALKELSRPWRSSRGVFEEALAEIEALETYADPADEAQDGRPLLVRRAIALGELGRYAEVQGELEAHAAELPERLSTALQAAYGRDGGQAGPPSVEDGWFMAVLAESGARRGGDEAALAAASGRRRTIEDATAARTRAPLLLQIGLVLAGFALLLAWLARDRPYLPCGHAMQGLDPRAGWAVLVRALLVYLVVGAACTFAETSTLPAPAVAIWYALHAARRRIALPGWIASPLHTLGLSRPWSAGTLVLAALCGAGLMLAADLAAVRLHEAFDGPAGAAQRLRAGLSGLSPVRCALLALEAALVGPLFAELALRGLLYGGSRAVRGPLWSLAVCALFQAALYGATPLGFLSALFSAAVACLLFERTRSLWPCVAASGLSSAASLWAQAALVR